MNKDCAEYCIAVIRAVMQEAEIPKIPENVTLPDLYRFAKKHDVETMVYHGLKQRNINEADPLWQDWCHRADMLLTQSIVQLSEKDMLMTALPAAGIRVLPVKGCWLKEEYPEIDYRQMSDLDILIDGQNGKKAKEIMQAQGYTAETDVNDHHDSYFKVPYMNVELHQSLLPEEDENYAYYHNIWEKVVPVPGFAGVFQMTPEDEYIYYIVHLYKHIQYAGTGIRSFLDSVVYRDNHPDMDRQYLESELTKLNLWGLTQQIETLSDCWFRSGTPVPQALQTLAECILTSGSYGSMDNYIRMRTEELEQKYRNPVVRAFAYWGGRMFRPRKEMARIYPVLNKAPFLLPVFWIYRAAEKLITRPKEMFRQIRLVFCRGKTNDNI